MLSSRLQLVSPGNAGRMVSREADDPVLPDCPSEIDDSPLPLSLPTAGLKYDSGTLRPDAPVNTSLNVELIPSAIVTS